MIEAIVFGFFAYFGTELGKYAHEKYDQVQACLEAKCYNNNLPSGEIQILTEDNKEMSTTELGDDNG